MIHLLIQKDYQVGERQPKDAGYLAWHEWADTQHKGGLRQAQCGRCGLWRYPQDMSPEIDTMKAKDRRGEPVEVATPVCIDCDEKKKAAQL